MPRQMHRMREKITCEKRVAIFTPIVFLFSSYFYDESEISMESVNRRSH